MITRIVGGTVLALLVFAQGAPTSAQLLNKEAPIIVSHYHLNVTSIDEHKKFWVDTLGGTAMKFGPNNIDVIKFPDVFLFLRQQKPTGPTRGTAFDHIGFSVPSVPAVVEKVTANGFELTFGREPAPGAAATPAPGGGRAGGAPPAGGAAPAGGGRAGAAGGGGRGGGGPAIAYILGPDGAKVEIVTNRDADAPPIKHHHVHYINKQYVEMQQWYMKAFNATLRDGQTDFFIGADLPGVGYMLNFFRWEGDQSVVHAPTTGRVYDHIGFEVRNLEAFVKELEGKGIKLTAPYRRAPELNNIATAMIVDPWGVAIELTEGMRSIP